MSTIPAFYGGQRTAIGGHKQIASSGRRMAIGILVGRQPLVDG